MKNEINEDKYSKEEMSQKYRRQSKKTKIYFR
jgi:hypothetical protein